MQGLSYVRGFLEITIVYIVLVVRNAFIWISNGVYLANSTLRVMRGRIMARLGQGVASG